MEVRSLKFFAGACGGERRRGSPETLISGICTDSRLARAGDLFVALSGERFDAHAFLPEVAKKGIAAVLVEQSRAVPELPDCAVIAVENTRRALGQIAAEYRKAFSLPIIVVGGSNGKTTTKELVASVLRQKLSTLWSESSFNNDVGVPLSLLRLEEGHQVAVLEAGTNHPGELRPLVKMIQPKFGVITNVAREHLEFFDDLEGVAEEEGVLAELLPPDGTLFINGDNEWTPEIAGRTRAQIVRVGMVEGNDWRATGIHLDKAGATFQVETANPDLAGRYRINLLGRHQVVNALLALAAGAVSGLDRAELERGLAECQPPKMRLQIWELRGVCVLDDSYNANTDSVVAALQTLKELPCKGRRVAVLGDMAELGKHSEPAHEEIGRCAAEMGVEQLYAVGKMAPVISRAARQAGLNRVLEFNEVEPAAEAVKKFLKAGDVLLLKASRSSRLERIAALLRADDAATKN
jgi:UDP-N-acetylmuramoyl-tripeptide--D-alanyl-D-alanine ligase